MPGLTVEPPPWYEQGFQTTTYRGDGSMTLHQSMADAWKRFQDELFPSLREQVGHLGKRHQRLVAILDLAPIEGFLPGRWRGTGRRPQDRRAIARAFIAKAGAEPADRARPAGPAAVRPGAAPAVRPAPSRRDPERGDLLECVRRVRRGRAARAPARVAGDDRLCRCACRPHLPRLDRHLRAGEAGAEAEAGDEAEAPAGRPRRGEEIVKEPSRLERQSGGETACDVGVKKNSKGCKESWTGFKLNVDCADGDIPISCFLPSASLHNSQAAIPLARLSATRVTFLYELMDAA